ncbi:MAG: GNAT family N-acetyltransferase [Cyclobacteriaceae bacterium]|nr:GNAT family N-acetyltransferase [Cyclobacteriaceae bacterium]UYN87931.1 MAG: GNAT family N-acetyltransferase [Cyclobacteriaceae bacterium]
MKYLLENKQSERLFFRKIQSSDADQWFPFFTDPNNHLYWPEERGTPEEECSKWFEKQAYRYENDLGGMNALIEKSSGLLVGYAGLLVQEVDGKQELEIAYSLLPTYWGRGYATEAAMKCKEYAFENDFAESLISIISLPNVPSQKVALKNGMTIEKQSLYKNIPVYIFRIFRPVNP